MWVCQTTILGGGVGGRGVSGFIGCVLACSVHCVHLTTCWQPLHMCVVIIFGFWFQRVWLVVIHLSSIPTATCRSTRR